MSLNPSIRKVVPASPPTATASYDYYDIASGIGLKNFYVAQALSSGALTDYYLTTDATDYSGRTSCKMIPAGAGYTTDDNYEVTFNLPKIIKGNVRVSVLQGLAAGGAGQFVFLLMKLYKVSGGVVTQLGDEVCTNPVVSIGSTTTFSRENTVFVVGRTHFKKGDILRLNIKVYASNLVSTGYGTDPAGRDDVASVSGGIIATAGNSTQLKVGVPFVLDI